MHSICRLRCRPRFTKKGLAIKKVQVTFAAAHTDLFAFDNLVYKG